VAAQRKAAATRRVAGYIRGRRSGRTYPAHVSAYSPIAIDTERLVLTPLRPGDADEMCAVLADEALYGFTGGHPPSRAELRDRYERLAAGSPYPDQIWLNWIVRRRSDGAAIGTVQATVTRRRPADDRAEVAWVLGVPFHGHGYAAEAARALVGWLRERGTNPVSANIHPDHHASAAVAMRAGLAVTGDWVDGERVWRTPPPDSP